MDNKFILYEQFLREPQAYTPKVVTIIAIIGLLLLLTAFIFRKFYYYGLSCIFIVTSIVVSMIFYLPIIGYEVTSVFGVEDKVPEYEGRYLKDFENNIKVEDNKVIIDNLEDKYYYADIVVDIKNYVNRKPKHIKRRVFKYDDFYDTKKLIDENGKGLKLNEEDTKFLKEKGVR